MHFKFILILSNKINLRKYRLKGLNFMPTLFLATHWIKQ